jgi:hypothetical protein
VTIIIVAVEKVVTVTTEWGKGPFLITSVTGMRYWQH